MEKQIIWIHKEDDGIIEPDSFGNYKCKLCGMVIKEKNLIDPNAVND